MRQHRIIFTTTLMVCWSFHSTRPSSAMNARAMKAATMPWKFITACSPHHEMEWRFQHARHCRARVNPRGKIGGLNAFSAVR